MIMMSSKLLLWHLTLYLLEKTGKVKYLEAENMFLVGERINIKGKGGEKEIWRRKIFLFVDEKNNREGKGGSFLRGQLIQKIICKRPVDLNDHLQEAGQSR